MSEAKGKLEKGQTGQGAIFDIAGSDCLFDYFQIFSDGGKYSGIQKI